MSLSPSQRRAAQWLIGGDHPATVDSLVTYYERRGRAQSNAAQTGRVGAARRMLLELTLAGAVADGKVTPEGRRAAQ